MCACSQLARYCCDGAGNVQLCNRSTRRSLTSGSRCHLPLQYGFLRRKALQARVTQTQARKTCLLSNTCRVFQSTPSLKIPATRLLCASTYGSRPSYRQFRRQWFSTTCCVRTTTIHTIHLQDSRRTLPLRQSARVGNTGCGLVCRVQLARCARHVGRHYTQASR